MKFAKLVGTTSVVFLLTAGFYVASRWPLPRKVSAQIGSKPYVLAEILRNQRLERPVRARAFGGDYYVLDARSHRLLRLDSKERFVREFGGFGTAPDRFNDPTDFAIGSDGKLYVYEAGNKRLTILDANGARVGGFAAPELSLGIAVSPQKEITLNQPQRGTLFTVYGTSGNVIRSFGDLRPPPASFSTHAHHDAKETYNRVHFAVDPSDNIYAAWWFEPRAQKYDRTGQLRWDIQLSGKNVEQFTQMARDNTGYYKYNGATVILSGITFDPSSNLAYVMFPSGTLYVLDQNGRKLGAFHDDRRNVWPLSSISMAANGKLLLTDTSQGVFSVTAPRT
jgi:hypothetical protein